MSSLDLPALVLPNTENSMDATVLLASGAEISAREFTQRLGSPAHLRFMASAGDGFSPAQPRVTWALLRDGDIVVSLAFPHGHDGHGRATSAAVVLDPRKDVALPERLPAPIRQALQTFLVRHRQTILHSAQTVDPAQAAQPALDPKKKARR